MTYEEAKEKVGNAAFNSCYSRVNDKKKKFKELYDDGPYKNVRRKFEDIKNDKEAFRSGDTNLYYELVENYEMDLGIVVGQAAENIKLAEGHCVSIMNGMDIDRGALAHALQVEEAKFNSLAPHIIDEYDDNGKYLGKKDLTAEHRAIAVEEGRKIWQAECCQWSK